MGLWKEVACPVCGARRARKLLWQIKCPNRKCTHHDFEVTREVEHRADAPPATPLLKGDFDPGSEGALIRYRNFRGEEKTFLVDPKTVRSGPKPLSFRMAPTGRRVALAKERILNWNEVEKAIQPYPTPNSAEAQLLGYYRKHPKQYSPRYEELRRKYPYA